MATSDMRSTNTALAPKVGHTQAQNHPQPGSTIRVDPIRKLKDIALLKKLLADQPRDLCIFITGINTNLRASDLLAVKVGDVRCLKVGDSFTIREKKTAKLRRITINRVVYNSVQQLLASKRTASDSEYLFASSRTGDRLTVPALNKMIKGWCRRINLPGNYGSHTLRKTWGFMMRTHHGIDIPTLMSIFNHSTQRQTLAYLCIQEADIQQCYLREI